MPAHHLSEQSETEAQALKRILIIDDEPELLRTLALMLASAGFTSLPVDAQRNVIEQIRQTEADLVITDMVMPEVSGWDVLEWMRANRPAIPVILVSGFVRERDDRIRAFAAHLQKPVRKGLLVETVAKVLEARRPAPR